MRWYEPNAEQQQVWEDWCDSRPPEVARIARRFPPWELYRIGSGHRCHVYSYGEMKDGTVELTVAVTGQFNKLAFSRRVFGIDPEELVPCDLPADDEETGEQLTQEEAQEVFGLDCGNTPTAQQREEATP